MEEEGRGREREEREGRREGVNGGGERRGRKERKVGRGGGGERE